MLVSGQRLCQTVHYYLSCRLELTCYTFAIHLLAQEMKLDVELLRPVMMCKILGQRNATLVGLGRLRRSVNTVRQVLSQTSEPNRRLRCAVHTYVLCFRA